MKEVLLTLTYLVGIGELILAGYFWKTNSGNEIRKVMALLAFSVGMWVISSAFIAYKAPTESVFLVQRFVIVFGIFLLTLLLHFTIVFPYPLFVIDRYHRILLYTPTVLFSVIAVSTNTISRGIFGNPNIAGHLIGGPLFNHYNVYLLLLYILSLWIMIKRLPRLDGSHYKITKLMIVAVIMGGLPAVILDLAVPLVAPNVFPNFLYGNLFTAVWLGATSYVIMRKV